MRLRYNSKNRIWLIVLVALAVLVLVAGFASAQAEKGSGMSVGPSKILVSLLQGGEYKETLRIENKSDSPLKVAIKPWNFAYDEAGQVHPVPAREAKKFRGCAEWLAQVEPSVVESNTEGKVPISLKVPEEASVGTHYAYIKVVGTPMVKGESGEISKAKIRYRLNALLLVVVQSPGDSPRLKAGAKLVKFTASQDRGNPVKFTAEIRNTGNTHLELSGKIKIKDEDGRLKDEIPIRGYTLLPERRSVIIRKWKKAPVFGKFTAQLFGQCEVSDIRQTFKSKPVKFSVGPKSLILVSALLLGSFLIVIITAIAVLIVRRVRVRSAAKGS